MKRGQQRRPPDEPQLAESTLTDGRLIHDGLKPIIHRKIPIGLDILRPSEQLNQRHQSLIIIITTDITTSQKHATLLTTQSQSSEAKSSSSKTNSCGGLAVTVFMMVILTRSQKCGENFHTICITSIPSTRISGDKLFSLLVSHIPRGFMTKDV
jgi:hypothetical protein